MEHIKNCEYNSYFTQTLRTLLDRLEHRAKVHNNVTQIES